jgi:hypothetical protein
MRGDVTMSSPITTANWYTASADRWELPAGGGFGKIFNVDRSTSGFRLSTVADQWALLGRPLPTAIPFPKWKHRSLR